jgi:uncharacterized protein YbaR (Trm112 family)
VNLDEEVLKMLACPACLSPLRVAAADAEIVCTNTGCALAYPVRNDIPVLLIEEARRPA